MFLPSSRNWTWEIPLASLALAVKVTVPLTVELFVGAVMLTLGAVGAGVVVAVLRRAVSGTAACTWAAWPACSGARAMAKTAARTVNTCTFLINLLMLVAFIETKLSLLNLLLQGQRTTMTDRWHISIQFILIIARVLWY